MASPLNAPVVPLVIFSDLLVVAPANVPVTHPHIIAPIGGLEVTSSTVMKDPVASHMSHIHEGIDTSSFMEGDVHSVSKSDGA